MSRADRAEDGQEAIGCGCAEAVLRHRHFLLFSAPFLLFFLFSPNASHPFLPLAGYFIRALVQVYRPPLLCDTTAALLRQRTDGLAFVRTDSVQIQLVTMSNSISNSQSLSEAASKAGDKIANAAGNPPIIAQAVDLVTHSIAYAKGKTHSVPFFPMPFLIDFHRLPVRIPRL